MSQMSDTLIDTIFDGRYRIVRKLGAGGMASVYLAEDDELGRRVAIKILNDRYATDDLFVERFRREAKSAAGLSHPNIVSIYDRGEAEGTYYIAMEVIEGRSLKELIRTQGRLRPAQAIAYARQILAALRFAHRNGIIHRDIKPHNILVGAEERLKVTDFGIARAGTSQMTEVGSVMGTAQYLSPEQARGAGVTAASDLYSVGIVLFEMLTGRVPFTGDTPVEIAMKHVNDQPRPPSAVAPGIPADLDRVVLRALAKSAADRYQTAEEFDSDLARIEAGLPIARETADAATAVLAAAGGGATAQTQVLRQREAPRQPPRRPPPQDPYGEPPRRKRSIFPWLLAVLLLAGAAVAGWYVYQRVQDELTAREPVAVPNVVGLKEQRALDLIERADLEAKVEEEASTDVPSGEVIDQDPAAGTRIAKGETVVITVSTGIPQVEVPKVSGTTRDEAIGILQDAGLEARVKEVFSEREVGLVLSQDPKPGRQVDQGSTVTIRVSKGVQTIAVPDVLFQNQDSAVAELEQAGLAASVVEVDSSEAAGLVVGQSPDPGAEVDVGATVEISVSLGPPPVVEVPSVIDLDEASAVATLEGAGFVVDVQETPVLSPDNDGFIVDQAPGPGEEVEPGTTVTILVGRFFLEEQSSEGEG
jgi:beta-lactam-binding protein with PASTA domain